MSTDPDSEAVDADRRSLFRRLSDAEIQDEVHDLRTRVQRLEDHAAQVLKLPEAVAELGGALEVLTKLVTSRFDGIEPGVEKASSVRTMISFAASVLVPIVVALIGGYVLVKTAGPR